MSQINDALKKAKQAQATAPARASAPQLRSPETDHPVRSGSSLMWPAIIVAVGLVGTGGVWLAMNGHKPDSQRTEPVAAVSSQPPAPKTEPPVAPTARDVLSPAPAPVATTAPTAEPTPAVNSPSPAVAAPPPAAPAPVLPRLSGIFFNPAHPTAILNTKLVSLGSRVGTFTVLAITQTSVTLAGGGQTNVLSLSE